MMRPRIRDALRTLAAAVPMLAWACTPAFGASTDPGSNLAAYSVVKLHAGLNQPNLTFFGRHLSIVIGHRENFNAHSFEVVTFYLSNGDLSKQLDIVGHWDQDKENLSLHVSGGADCLLHDFRLLKSNHALLLVTADRSQLGTYIDNEQVTFKYYAFRKSAGGDPGGPAYWFDLIGQSVAKRFYCDVGIALAHELELADYRSAPRPDGYWNSANAVSDKPTPR